MNPGRTVPAGRGIASVTAADVLKWFEEASESPKRKRRGIPLTAAHVAPIVKLVNAQQQWLCRSPSDTHIENRDAVVIGKLRKVQRAIRTLRDTLPGILEVYRRAGLDYLAAVDGAVVIRKHPEEVALQEILNAIERGPAYVGDPPKGRPTDMTLVLAESLVDPIRRAWENAGRHRVSFRTQAGPGIAVLRKALSAVTGKQHQPTAVVAMLRRARHRKGPAAPG
jgi:hypothetical protein